MNSREAILMAKLVKKKAPPHLSATEVMEDGEEFMGAKDPRATSGLSATSGGSLGMIKAHKAGNIGGALPTMKTGGFPQATTKTGEFPQLTTEKKKKPIGEVEFGPTEVYSPIKKYLKKGK